MSAKKSEMLSVAGTIWEIVKAIWNAVLELGGTDEDMRNVLKIKTMANDLALVILGRADVVAKTVKPDQVVTYLRRLGLLATIPATVGRRKITEASALFTGYLDSDFRNWSIGADDQVRPECPVEPLELAKNGKFEDFFPRSTADRDKLVLTDEQILWVVENRPDLLIQNGGANFFLQKKGEEFFVANVRWYEGGLGANVYRLSDDSVWYAGFRHRFVVPATVVPQSLCL